VDQFNSKNYSIYANTKLPISNLIKEMFKSLADQGNDNDDHSALYKEIENINKS